MMKRLLTISVLMVCVVFATKGQYLPTTGQPFQFAPLYNPAFSGIDPFGDIRLSYRSQIGNTSPASPKFFNAMYQVRLTQPFDGNLNGLRTSMPVDNSSQVRKQGIVHGMGVNIFDEELGLMTKVGGGINYAFHFPISEKWMLSVGTSAMVENLRIDLDKLYLGAGADPDPIYEQMMAGRSNTTQLNVRAGAVIYSRNFFFGASYLPLYKMNFQEADWASTGPQYQATVQTGVSFDVTESFRLRPSIVGLLDGENQINLDYGLKAYFRDILWLGATYRDTETGIAQLGYNINKTFSAAYAYEISTGAWKFGSGSHELVLSVRMNNFRNQTNYVW